MSIPTALLLALCLVWPASLASTTGEHPQATFDDLYTPKEPTP
jgi:hypothetical protein